MPENYMVIFIAFGVGIFGVVVLALILNTRGRGLNSIKSVRVGDGQHGDAEWATEKDLVEKGLITVEFPKELKDMSDKFPIGRVLHWSEDGKKAWIDPSSSHCATMAPTDVGKTTKYVVPNIMYNGMAGANMIIPDLKGEIFGLTGNDFKEKLNYDVVRINFSDVEMSEGIDYLEQLRESIENMSKYPERKQYWSAQAETQAKIIASQIQSSRDRGSQENGFFLSASNGILTTVLYLVAMYGTPETIHFSSVRSIIQELGTARKGSEGKSALQELLDEFPENFPPRKLSGAAYSAPFETEANIYASALSDLDIYTNAMAEQVIASSKKSFDWRKLIHPTNKTIVFIELPETRKDMFVFFTLFISQLYESLSQHAQSLPSQKLPKTLKVIWDEFGISPKIADLPTMLNVSRGRGILFDLIYQSEDQLEETYGKVNQQIIQKACNTNLYLGLAPKDIETAKNLSLMLGQYTVKSGSVSSSYSSKDILFSETNRSISEQMQAKDLQSADELLRMGAKSILIKQNMKPMQPNNIPFYAKEFPTKMMDHDPVTESQKLIIENHMNLGTIDPEIDLKEIDSYKKYLSKPTVVNAQSFITESTHLIKRVGFWNDIEYINFRDIQKYLKEDSQKYEDEKKRKQLEALELEKKSYKVPEKPINVALGDRYKEGHTLIGWLPEIGEHVSESGTHKAVWKRNEYLVAFDSRKGTSISNQSVQYEGIVKIPEPPTRENYEFDGWEGDIEKPIVKNTIFHAIWKPITKVLTLDLGDGQDPLVLETKQGKALSFNNQIPKASGSETDMTIDKFPSDLKVTNQAHIEKAVQEIFHVIGNLLKVYPNNDKLKEYYNHLKTNPKYVESAKRIEINAYLNKEIDRIEIQNAKKGLND